MNHNRKIKGIGRRSNKDGTLSFRVATEINGQLIRSSWSQDYDATVKTFLQMTGLRMKSNKSNQYTKNKNDITLRELLDKFEPDYAAVHAPNSLRSTMTKLKYIFSHVMDTRISSITDVAALISTMKAEDVCKTTVKSKISAIVVLREFAQAHDYPFNPNVEKMRLLSRSFRTNPERIFFLTAKDAANLFHGLTEHNSRYPKGSATEFACAAILAIYNGLRRGEILALNYKDIDLQNRMLTVRRTMNEDGTIKYSTKNGKTRTIPLSEHSYEVLKGFKDRNPSAKPDDLVFGGRGRSWIALWIKKLHDKGVLNPNYSFHTFRHTFASLFFKVNGTTNDAPMQLQHLLGHSDQEMTQSYVHLFNAVSGSIMDGLTFGEATLIDAAREKKKREILKSILNGESRQSPIKDFEANLDLFMEQCNYYKQKLTD